MIAEAELGEEAKNFLEGNLGKFLRGVAVQEIRLAQENLGDVDPENTIAIKQFQNNAFRWKQFIELLEGLVAKGDQAILIYRQQSEE